MTAAARRRILIVEDEAIVAADLEMILRELGYEVVGIAGDGEEAVAAALGALPDLILMDVRLRGDVDGITAAQRIHQRASIPVVFLTAYADAETLRRASLPSTFGYLIKPFDGRELAPAIEFAVLRHALESRAHHVVSRLEEALTLLEEGLIALGADGVVEHVSESAARQLGLDEAAVIGRPVEEVVELETDPGFTARGALVGAGLLRSRQPASPTLRYEKIRRGDGHLLRCVPQAAQRELELDRIGRGVSRSFESVASSLAEELRPRLEELRGTVRLLSLPEGVGPERPELGRRLGESLDRIGAIVRRIEMGSEDDELEEKRTALEEPVRLALAESAGLADRRGIELSVELPPGLGEARMGGRGLGEALAALVEELVERSRRGDALRVAARAAADAGSPRLEIRLAREPRAEEGVAGRRALAPVGARAAGGFGFDFARRLLERHGGEVRRVGVPPGLDAIVVTLPVAPERT